MGQSHVETPRSSSPAVQCINKKLRVFKQRKQLHKTFQYLEMEDNQLQQPQEHHLFDDFTPRLTQASAGKRLANYLIDLVGFYVFMYFFSYVLLIISYDLAVIIYGEGDSATELLGSLIILIFYGMYMGLLEALLKGRSLGKFITGTIVVNEDGTRISEQSALLRGLCRAVPFNAFSALGSRCYPWHDRWTKTYVVNYKDFELANR
jgi:uncharacterized RDD family membrane protein YckC